MKIIKSSFVITLFMAMSLTSAFAGQSREKLDASQFESASDKIENVESNTKTNHESKVCDLEKKAETNATNQERILLRHRYNEWI